MELTVGCGKELGDRMSVSSRSTHNTACPDTGVRVHSPCQTSGPWAGTPTWQGKGGLGHISFLAGLGRKFFKERVGWDTYIANERVGWNN